MHYLDNAATTCVAQSAADVADEVLRAHFANPSSLYGIGAKSELVIKKARETVAHSLGCTAAEITFTSCGSEGNNIAIQGACAARKAWANNIVVTGYEHPSVQNTVAAMRENGFDVTVIYPDENGIVSIEEMAAAVNAKTALVAAMHVNNEIGAALDVARLAALVKEKNRRTAVHIDGVQAWGKLKIKLADTQIDTYTVSGHKIHAPKGIGALYIRKGFHILPYMHGGGQERGLRPGTENTAYIAAMAKACELAQADFKQKCEKIAAISSALRAQLEAIEGVTLNSPKSALPDIINFSVENIKSETMLHFLESNEIYVSSGSACSKGEASHTLSAMKLPKTRIDTAIRVSFSYDSTAADTDALIAALKEGIATIAKIRR